MAVMEVAGWYAPPGISIDRAQHTHLIASLPLHDTLRGIVTVPLTIRLHGKQRVKQVRLVLGDGGAQITAWTVSVNFQGPGDFKLTPQIDTRKYRYDGWCHWRFRVDTIDERGKAGNVRTIWGFTHANGFKRREPTDYTGSWARFTEGQALYAGSENVQNRLRSPISKTVRGTWGIEMMFDRWGSRDKYPPNGYAPSLVRSLLLLDPPDLCASPPLLGVKLLDEPRKFVGTVPFDSTKYTNGPHTLVMRCDEKPLSSGQQAIVYAIPIVIGN